MSLIRFEEVSIAFGDRPLLEQVSFGLEKQDRVCVIGRNGAGKSTLLGLAAGRMPGDEGHIYRQPGLVIGELPQDLPAKTELSLYQMVAQGLGELGGLLEQYQTLSQIGDAASLAQMQRVQEQIEAQDGWRFEQKIQQILSRFNLPAEQQVKNLSGGWRRRVALAQALVAEPDLLLLDEPTNHLDISTIEWLEQQIADFNGALLFITHDRTFLQNVANRIIELDRGAIIDWRGDYRGFLEFKEQQLAVEARANALFDKRLAEEERWIRQGIKARRTRNEGRVRALKEMRKERSARFEVQGTARAQVSDAQASGKIVAELTEVSHAYGGRQLIECLSLNVQRGDRIGLLGPNGCGKSTLLNILLGKLTPDRGQVRFGSRLEVAYFDQLKDQLDEEKSIIENIDEGRDFIELDGRQKHIISYLNDFLFSAERARTPVKALSGGEKNRVLLAKLFSKPANLLVLDEPTNDLDVETLELLEELLLAFKGTLLIVSHDRSFLDNVVSSVLAFEGQAQVTEHVGGYSDWWQYRQRQPLMTKDKRVATDKTAIKSAQADASKEKAPPLKKLSYKEKLELEQLPAKIDALEQSLEQLRATSNAADFYSRDHKAVEEILQQLSYAEQSLEQCIERWADLEDRAG